MRVRPRSSLLFRLLCSWAAGCLLLPGVASADPNAVPGTATPAGTNAAQGTAQEPDAKRDGEISKATALPEAPEVPGAVASAEEPAGGSLVWGILGLRGFAFGQQVAPNGLEFNPLFSLDIDLNLWLWREGRVYAFSETRFWGQKPAPGITNASQGVFDFSKREFDLDVGAAWNYWGMLEARAFAYSFNNLNRGSSDARPSGYNDGVGLENRWYVGGTYANLGLPGFDLARANFLSVGYYPTKDMVDNDGNTFKPGPFARAFLTADLSDDGRCYLYLDTQFIGTRTFGAKLLDVDGGIAVRPFSRTPFLEFRLGSEDNFDLQLREAETSLYLSLRFNF